MARKRNRAAGRSLFGPIFLIALGTFMLLAMMHVVRWPSLGQWFARYWPAILIAWGVIRLLEYFIARQQDRPAPRFGGGAVFLVVLIVLLGAAATSAHRNIDWSGMDDEFEVHGPFGEMINGEPHEFDIRKDAPLTGNDFSFDADRADVTVLPSSDSQVHVQAHLTVYAHSEQDAENTKNKFSLDLSGSKLTATRLNDVHAAYDIQVPPNATVEVTNTRGDVTVRDRKTAVTINTQKSDVTAENIGGNLTVHSDNRSNVAAHGVDGDVIAQGRFDDLTATDVTGALSLDGDFFGDMHLQKIGKGVRFHSSRTDLELAKVEGEMEMSSGDLHATSIQGPVRLVTRSKNVNLERVSGDVDLENQNANVEIEPASPVGNVRVQNARGEITFTAPSNANFVLEARSDHGQINSDLNIPVNNSEHGSSTVNATIGKGGNRVVLTADRGTISLHQD
ncbi:MAG TPA: DUF4097 family beta strand repeat-containing protein [Terriglobales bacterium]|jgi:DUF4097 and DUF4098 domain-containing protein YvlB